MNIKLVRPSSFEEKKTRSTVDTVELNAKRVASWKVPPFQRELKINKKVEEVAKQIEADGGVLPGIITLGVLDGDVYMVDGQHRIAAFTTSGCEVGYADARTVFFENMADMAAEFEQLNSQLVTLRPDDKLRALEHSIEALQVIRKKCTYVGYGQVRRNGKSAVLSMSTLVRVWAGSKAETPVSTIGATTAAKAMTTADALAAAEFFGLCYTSWQRDKEFARLWSGLNLMILAWMYRRMVLGEHGSSGLRRYNRLSPDQFRRGLTSLSAEASYLEYLVGRHATDRDRTPTYNRICSLFRRRLAAEVTKLQFPAPAWSAGAR